MKQVQHTEAARAAQPTRLTPAEAIAQAAATAEVQAEAAAEVSVEAAAEAAEAHHPEDKTHKTKQRHEKDIHPNIARHCGIVSTGADSI